MYLFNADNVVRCTGPDHADRASPGSVIDTSCAALERCARGQAPLPQAMPLPAGEGTPEPPLWHQPPADVCAALPMPDTTALAQAVAGHRVQLVHPWAPAEPAADADTALLRLGAWLAEHIAARPWSARRRAFVAARLQQISNRLVWADGVQL